MFDIINPELVSGYNHNDYIILKNGRSYDKCIKCGCVVLSIANDEYNQHYNAEPFLLINHFYKQLVLIVVLF